MQGAFQLAVAAFVALALSVSGCGGGGGQDPGPPKDYPTPVLVSETLRFVALDTSQAHTCGTTLDGGTWCWGINEYGELGTGTTLDLCDIPGITLVACTGAPQRVVGAPVFTALATSLGSGHSCGLTAAGAAWCWGFGVGGQLGDGRSINSTMPVAVAGGLAFTMLRASTSSHATCGLTASGEGWCWGPAADLFGGGSSGMAATPVRVDWGRPFVALDLGELHGCGLGADGRAWCWGSNWYGQLGVGSAGGSGGLARSNTPLAVVGGRVYRSIASGADHSCALDLAGAAWCWGVAMALGSPTAVRDYVGTPQTVAGGHVFTALASGQLHTCGLTAAGEVWCWGQNYNGELGDGTRTAAQIPVRVDTGARFDRLAHRASCALTADGQAWCWGGNTFGQVGRRSHWAQ